MRRSRRPSLPTVGITAATLSRQSARGAGIGGAIFLGERWAVLDPITAVVVSVFIIKTARLRADEAGVRRAVGEEPPGGRLNAKIKEIAEAETGVSGIHNLRTRRRMGNRISIEMHLRMLR